MRKGRPTPSMIVAVMALVVALGGTAVAASRYVITSQSQIKPSVVSALAATSRGAETSILTNPVTVKAGATRSISAVCLKGEHIVTGGYSAELPPGAYVEADAPALASSWIVVINANKSTSDVSAQAKALCAAGTVPLTVRTVNAP